MKKRILILTLALILASTSTLGSIPSVVEASTPTMKDIETHWGKKYIDNLIEKGGITGYPDGSFKPNNQITKAEFMTIALRSALDGKVSAKVDEHWASGIFKDATDKGVVLLSDFPKTDWNKPINRYEMAYVMVSITEKIFDEAQTGTIDVEKIMSDYNKVSQEAKYKYYVEQAFMKGLVTGKTADGQYDGAANGTRAEAATMVVRMLDKSIREKVDTTKVITSTIEFTDAGPIAKIIGDVAFTNKVIGGEGDGEITYVSGTPKTATVDKETGKVTIVAVGTTVITASKEATKTHSAVTNTYTINVSAKDATPLTKINDIIGEAKVGVELTAGSLTPNYATATYQWQRIWMNYRTLESIPDATSNKYTPVAGDEGWKIRVSATGSGDYSGTVTSEYTGVVATNKIVKTDPIINKAVAATSINAGQKLESSKLSGTFKNSNGQAISGTLEWQNPKVELIRTGLYGWSFVPDDVNNYNSIQGEVSVNTDTTDPIIDQKLTASRIKPGDKLSMSKLSGTFKDSAGNVVEGTLSWQLPDYIMRKTETNNWTFTPIKLALYNIIEGTIEVVAELGEFEGGSGTVGDPYLVSTPDQMNNVRNHLDKHFKQTEDINLLEYTVKKAWNPIGSSSNMFTGSFNGNGKEISKNISAHSDLDGQGLFGFTASGAKLYNITLSKSQIDGKFHVGALVGHNNGSVINCVASGKVTGSADVGGLVGYNTGLIDGCEAEGQISGAEEIGGLVGTNFGGVIRNSMNKYNSVTGSYNVGGLVGSNLNGGLIENCYTVGKKISGWSSGGKNIGGLVGLNSGIISSCYTSFANVNGEQFLGGLVGYNKGAISISYASDAQVKGKENVTFTDMGYYGKIGTTYYKGYDMGGLVGYNDKTIDNSYATGGSVWGWNNLGGLVGTANKDTSITNSYSSVEVIPSVKQYEEHFGGLVGYKDGKVVSCYYDKETSYQDDTGKGDPKSTAEMKTQTTFKNWDFTNIWKMDSNSYPSLRWQK
ncbi:MAG: GLUG motif-containing protein [Gudongella sp.]|nr:GLUG motif-containing protein [Gudongella sp.]